MSHLADLDLAFNDLDALEKAVTNKGGTLHRGVTSYKWVGKWYDDSPVPSSLFADPAEHARVCAMTRAERKAYMQSFLGKCSHMISFPSTDYQVGVVQVGEDLRLVWDWATPLAPIMGSMDGWGRDSLNPLTPFLQDYVTYTLENQLANTPGAMLTEHSIDPSTGLLNITYEFN